MSSSKRRGWRGGGGERKRGENKRVREREGNMTMMMCDVIGVTRGRGRANEKAWIAYLGTVHK